MGQLILPADRLVESEEIAFGIILPVVSPVFPVPGSLPRACQENRRHIYTSADFDGDVVSCGVHHKIPLSSCDIRDGHFQPFSYCSEGLFQLIQPRRVLQVQQPVNLWQVTLQPPGQFGFADPLLTHQRV
jgi:hypothetical protein